MWKIFPKEQGHMTGDTASIGSKLTAPFFLEPISLSSTASSLSFKGGIDSFELNTTAETIAIATQGFSIVMYRCNAAGFGEKLKPHPTDEDHLSKVHYFITDHKNINTMKRLIVWRR
jgi:hypothetical protein